jgi:methionyl-tRNA formyltransferase
VATVAASDADDEPGRFVPDERGLALATSDGRLVLDEVQPAGGRPMSGDAFVRGRPSILGRTVRRHAASPDASPAARDRAVEPA